MAQRRLRARIATAAAALLLAPATAAGPALAAGSAVTTGSAVTGGGAVTSGGTSNAGSSNAFNELTRGQAEAPATTTTASRGAASTESGSGTISRTLILGAVCAAVVLLGGIAFVIVRDARRVAPASEADLQLVEARAGHDAAVRLRRRRAAAKAARRQRKKNR